MDEKHLLAKDVEDRRARLSTLISNVLSGRGMTRPLAYAVQEAWINDDDELARSMDILKDRLGDTDASVRPEECSGFMRVLSDERRLLRDTDEIMSGHKVRFTKAFSAAYGKLISGQV